MAKEPACPSGTARAISFIRCASQAASPVGRTGERRCVRAPRHMGRGRSLGGDPAAPSAVWARDGTDPAGAIGCSVSDPNVCA